MGTGSTRSKIMEMSLSCLSAGSPGSVALPANGLSSSRKPVLASESESLSYIETKPDTSSTAATSSSTKSILDCHVHVSYRE